LCVSLFTIFKDYSQPADLFWDENYHVASAQKYLHGVFFMEPHPPLGKLLIAAGELLLDTNSNDSVFVDTEQGREPPSDFSFTGYRFFPVVCSCLAAMLFYVLLAQLTGSPYVALIFALCFVLDNALVVHLRGAMLEGIQLFFILGTLVGVASIYQRGGGRRGRLLVALLSGISFGAALSTKLTSLIIAPAFLLYVPALGATTKRLYLTLATSVVGAAVTYLVIWQVHFALGQRIEPALANEGFFQSSEITKKIVQEGEVGKLSSYPQLLVDNVAFFPHYERGVAGLNMCGTAENGSTPWLWPLGARSISYRWDRTDDQVSYLYLQINPVVWMAGLAGLVIAASFWLSWFLGKAQFSRDWILTTGLFLSMWFGYMGVMVSLDRVMYLYHYFIPLLCSLILAALVVCELKGSWFSARWLRAVLGGVFIAAVFTSFRYFSPLTYATPLTNEELARLSWFRLWDLHCPDCELSNPIARPLCDPKVKKFPQIRLGEVQAGESYQEWGEPIQGVSVDRKPVVVAGQSYSDVIGTHAKSNLRFTLGKRYQLLSGSVGLPDYVLEKEGTPASVEFEVWADHKRVWTSKRITHGVQEERFSLDVSNVELLELVSTDAGDGNTNDHAVWLAPQLR
jgi:hypothetical protein